MIVKGIRSVRTSVGVLEDDPVKFAQGEGISGCVKSFDDLAANIDDAIHVSCSVIMDNPFRFKLRMCLSPLSSTALKIS